MGIVEQYLLQLKTEKRKVWHAVIVLTALSLFVAFAVSWNLRLTGITIANDATCNIVEHQHTSECLTEQKLICEYDSTQSGEEHIHTDECYETVYLCGYEEHIHDLSCYSQTTADIETAEDWEASLPKLTGNITEDIVLVAQSQIGCGESEKNYVVADDGVTKRGITRYGQWYGNPYGEWSSMFTSFCLRYANE